MRKLSTVLLELILVFAAIWTAHILENSISYIPRSLISLPQVDYSFSDLQVLLIYFMVIHTAVFLVSAVISAPWNPKSIENTARRIFVLMFAYSLSTLSVFLTSSINFDPNLVVGIALFSGLYIVAVGLVYNLKHGLLNSIRDLFAGVIKRALSVSGALIIILTLSPAILAAAFVKDRDFANSITQLRMKFSNVNEAEYSLVSALGAVRFQQPMLTKSPATDPNNLYVLQRNGKLFQTSTEGQNEPQLLIDLTEKVGFVEMENGALGFDFHPQFSLTDKQYPYLYLYYTSVHDKKQKNFLSRFDLSNDSADSITGSEQVLMELNRESSGFHNGGSVEFGDDGFLYLAIGEGVRTPEHKLFSNTFRMGILRIDVDERGGEISTPITRQPDNGTTQNYAIPADNPFRNNPDVLDEYWALGLRNPFRISYDAIDQQWWAGDVGSTKWEEINILEAGKHYQFPFIEGDEETGKQRPSPMHGVEQAPLYSYFHTATERAVIGGEVYRGSHFPELQGQYLFADNYSGNLYRLDTSGELPEKVTVAASNDYAQRGISSVSQHVSGDIYVTTLGKASGKTGRVLKLVRGNVSSEPDLEEVAALTEDDIAEIYTTNCARCHGTTGNGDGPDQKLLKVEIADFTSANYKQQRNIVELRSIIAEGGTANGLSPMMPPWSNILTNQEIDALSQWILTLEE